MRFQVPAAVRLLIAQNTLHHGIRTRCGLADQPEEMHHMERGRHVIAQVTVSGLVLRDVPGDGVTVCRGKRLSQRRVKQRIETQRVPGKLFEGVVRKEPLHDVGAIEFRLCAQRAQAHSTLCSVVENGKVSLRVELPLEIHEHTVRLLVALDEVHGACRVRQLPSQRLGQRRGVGDRGQITRCGIRITGVFRIGRRRVPAIVARAACDEFQRCGPDPGSVDCRGSSLWQRRRPCGTAPRRHRQSTCQELAP